MGTDLLPFSEVTSVIASASVVGILLLLPLYLSQRRDVLRLREWMLQDPEHPLADLERSERLLDQAEIELEQTYVQRGEPVPGTMEFQALHPETIAAAAEAGLTGEHPALDQLTIERAALEPHPRLKRFGGRITQPRWLASIGVAALAIAVAGIVIVQQVLSDDGGDSSGETAVELSGLEVAVLNTTSASGVAGKTARQIEESGYLRGTVGVLDRAQDQTLVMYAEGQLRGAKRVAKQLGGVAVQEIDQEVEAAADGADVVVILGEDRVGG